MAVSSAPSFELVQIKMNSLCCVVVAVSRLQISKIEIDELSTLLKVYSKQVHTGQGISI